MGPTTLLPNHLQILEMDKVDLEIFEKQSSEKSKIANMHYVHMWKFKLVIMPNIWMIDDFNHVYFKVEIILWQKIH